MVLDTSFYYRLTNAFQGPGFALDVKPDGTGRLMTASTGGYSGQYWRLVDLGGGKYALRTLYLGECFSLDVIADGNDDTPWLNATGNFSGQSWSVTPWGNDGSWRLTNDFTGADRSLNVQAGSFEPIVGPGDFSGQHWFLDPIRKIDAAYPVPDLDPRGNDAHTEGPSNYVDFARPLGNLRAVMIFVDFADAPGVPGECLTDSQFLLGNGKFRELYREQSYGKLDIEVDVRADLDWRRIQHSSTIDLTNGDQQRDYVVKALQAFPEVSFGSYAFVIIVPPRSAKNVTPSPGFNPGAGNAVPTLGGPVYLGVTVGFDVWKNVKVQKFSYTTLVHEVGHLFDLPDLSPTNVAPDKSNAGCWDLMSDIFNSVSFLGWHRRKNGWLDSSRTLYIDRRTSGWYTTLHPLTGGCGLSMVALPIDDPAKPSTILVIEVAQPGTDSSWGQGILIYTVDATIPTGMSPVVVKPKTAGVGPNSANLYLAPFGVGDHADVVVGKAHVTVDVLQRFGSSYNVQIGYRRITSWVGTILDAVRDLFGGFVEQVRSLLGLPDPPTRWPRAREPGLPARVGQGR